MHKFYADIKSHLNFQFLEPKCFCVHPLEAQRQSEEYNETLVQIVCETNYGLEPSGGCGRDEYCAGLNTLDDAVCGKTNLCTKKGNTYVELNFCFCNLEVNCSIYLLLFLFDYFFS